MEELQMRIVDVPAMRVARFHGFGPEPEMIAFESMKSRLLSATGTAGRPPRIFGFNNPNPEPGSPNYGYEFWVQILAASDLEAAAADVEVGEFAGGRYAALRHDGTGETIPATWKRLVGLLSAGGYDHAHHQWLEEHFVDFGARTEVLYIDCLAPIR